MNSHAPHDDHRFANDLNTLAAIDRRQMLRCIAIAGLLPVSGCGSTASTGAAAADGGDPGSCGRIPEETGGPYPGDGTNGPNALMLGGIVRSDIRSSIGTLSGMAEGVVLTLTLTVVRSNGSCDPLAGYAVYLWHCDAVGDYSMYTNPNQNYLRGVQETDAEGNVTFTTIFPGCYPGRMPHIHFEVYPSLSSATSAADPVATSQLGFPDAACEAVYATAGYEASVGNYARISFATDNVFSDGTEYQIAIAAGSASSGYSATLLMGIAV